MSVSSSLPNKAQVNYPESDGMPMADNMLQFRWIVTLQGGLDWMFRDTPNVLVAGDLLWYPVEGENRICCAPDVMVIFSRPKGDRRSYLQWLEEDIPPQVVFEVLSHSNRQANLGEKRAFYERYGVEEYYLIDPEGHDLRGWHRREGQLVSITGPMLGYTSPRLGVKFDRHDGELQVFGPDGKPFGSYMAVVNDRELELQRAERLAAQLRALGIEPEA